MNRIPPLACIVASAAFLLPFSLVAQASDHGNHVGHGHDAAHGATAGHEIERGHSHASGPVDCRILAAPPWVGLSAGDRDRIAAVQHSVAHLSTPRAARAAGFVPVLGDIPGMGVHYVHTGRTRAGVNIEEPDHLLFAQVEGEERLVGVAYAFNDVVDTAVPIPFESDLAHWHDHPELAPAGQTLHMLHVWFIPSSNGPFAGLNFWLPFHGAGVTPPSACWMASPSDAARIQTVSFALASSQRGIGQLLGRIAAIRAGAGVGGVQSGEEARASMLADMDAAARAEDRDAWVAAADRFIGDMTPVERTVVQALLQGLTMAQMSTPEREAEAGHSGH